MVDFGCCSIHAVDVDVCECVLMLSQITMANKGTNDVDGNVDGWHSGTSSSSRTLGENERNFISNKNMFTIVGSDYREFCAERTPNTLHSHLIRTYEMKVVRHTKRCERNLFSFDIYAARIYCWTHYKSHKEDGRRERRREY